MSRASTTLSPAAASRALRRWGIDARSEEIVPGSGTANASVIVDCDAGKFVLRRRNPRYARTDWVRFDHALLAHLAADGLPVPRGVRAECGRAWLRERAHVYELFEFIEGQAHREGDPAELKAAGRVLAELHTSAARFESPVTKAWPRFHDPEDARDGLEELLADAGDEDATALREALALARDLAERFPDERYWSLPRTVVQGDYHPANLKFDDGDVVGVFDWDWASDQPRMVDVADGLLFFCGEREAPLVGGDIWSLTASFTIDQARVERFLEGYEAVLMMTPDEREALPDLMRCRWLYCRVDAARRKVAPERRVQFVVRGIEHPLRGINCLDAKLQRD
ncbi:MAG: phosphotransferase [Armatimonadota bacterium]